MSSGDSDSGGLSHKYVGSRPESNNHIEAWEGPKQRGELYVLKHKTGTIVEVSARAGDASYRDELLWLVIVRPGANETGRRITQFPLFTKEAALKRAAEYAEDHPDGGLPTTSYDEWGVEQ